MTKYFYISSVLFGCVQMALSVGWSQTAQVQRAPASIYNVTKPRIKKPTKSVITENIEQVKIGKKKYLVFREMQNGVSTQQIITGPQTSETIIDSKARGVVDQWEFAKGDVTLRASFPVYGIYRKLEYSRHEKNNTLTAEFIYNFKRKKYALVSLVRSKHRVFSRDDIRLCTSKAEDVKGMENEKDFLDLLNQLNSKIDISVQKDRAQSLANELFKEIDKNKENLFDPSCLEGPFKDTGTLNTMMQAMANVMASVPAENGNSSYLQCLSDNKLGFHAARIRSKMFSGMMNAGMFGAPTANSYGNQPDRPKPFSCEDVQDIRTQNAMDGLETPQSNKDYQHANYADYNQAKRQITFYQKNTGMSSMPLATGDYKDTVVPKLTGDAAALKNFELSFFHEMVHRSGIESENWTHSIQDCCGLAQGGSGSACAEMTRLISEENNRQSMSALFAGNNSGGYQQLSNDVSVVFPQQNKANNFMNDYGLLSKQYLEEARAEIQACVDKKRSDIECQDEARTKMVAKMQEKSLVLCQREFLDSKTAAEKCPPIQKEATQLLAGLIPKTSCSLASKPTEDGLEKFISGGLPKASRIPLFELVNSEPASSSSSQVPGAFFFYQLFPQAYAATADVQHDIDCGVISNGVPDQAAERVTLKRSSAPLPDDAGVASKGALDQAAVQRAENNAAAQPSGGVAVNPSNGSSDQITKLPEPQRAPASTTGGTNTAGGVETASAASSSSLGSSTGRTGFESRNNRSQEIFDRLSGGIESVLSIPSAQAAAVTKGDSKDSRTTKSKEDPWGVLKEHSKSAESRAKAPTNLIEDKKETSDATVTAEPSLRRKLAMSNDRLGAGDRRFTEPKANKGTAGGKPSGDAPLADEKSEKDPAQKNAKDNSDEPSDPTGQLLLSEIEHSPREVLGRMKSLNSRERNEYKEKLANLRIQIIDQSGRVFGSQDPSVTYRYDKKIKKFIKQLNTRTATDKDP